MPEIPQTFQHLVVYSSLPGVGGGVTAFLLALKGGHYRNNKYIAKLAIEAVGATLIATFLGFFISTLVNQEKFLMAIAFVAGMAWAGIAQLFRAWLTGIIAAFLGTKQG